MKKIMMLVAAAMMFSGCGVLEGECVPPDNLFFIQLEMTDTSCPQEVNVYFSDYRTSWYGADEDPTTCGLYFETNQWKMGGTSCTFTEYIEGYMTSDGPENLKAKMEVNCPEYQCIVRAKSGRIYKPNGE